MAACAEDREGLIAELFEFGAGFGCNESKGLRIEPERHVEPEFHIATGRGRHLWRRRECRDGSPHGGGGPSLFVTIQCTACVSRAATPIWAVTIPVQ